MVILDTVSFLVNLFKCFFVSGVVLVRTCNGVFLANSYGIRVGKDL